MVLEPMGYTAANRRTIKLMVEQAAPLFEDGSAPMFMVMADAIAAVAVGKLFYAIAPAGAAYAGEKRLYLRTAVAPFYEDQGNAAAPATRARVDAAAAENAQAVAALTDRQDEVEETVQGALSSSSYRPTPEAGADLPVDTYFLAPNAADGGTLWVYQRIAGAPGYTAIQKQEFSADQIADGETNVSMTVGERQALGEWMTPAQTPVADAYIAKATGQPVAQANYQYVDYDRVGDESGLRFSAAVVGTLISGAVYLDASGQHIAGANEIDGTASVVVYTDQQLNPPANWAKLRVTGRSDVGGGVLIHARRPSSDMAERVTGAAVALAETQADLDVVKGAVSDTTASLSAPGDWVTPAQTPVSGSYINRTTGAPTALANYQYVKIALTGHETGVRATALLLGTVAALAVYYDASNAFISAEVLGTESAVQYTDYVLTPPATARYVAITGREGNTVAVQTRGSVVAANVAGRVSAAEQSITELENSVGGFEGTIDGVVSSLSRPGEWTSPAQAAVANTYINKANGAPVAQANYQYVKVPLTGSEAGVRATAYVLGTVIALATYYDASNAFISTEVLGTGTGVQYTNHVLSPPPNARFVAICGRSDAGRVVQVQTRVTEVAPSVAADLQALQEEFASASSGLGTTDLCMFGDSQTEASSGYGDDLAALYPDRVAYNQGIGGQTLPMIAARMGATPVTLTAAVTIPTSGSVTIAHTILSIDLLRRVSGTAVIRALIAGVECALAFDSTLFSGAGGYTLTPLDYPPAAVVAASGTRVEVLTGFVFGTDPANCPPIAAVLGGVVCIRAGRNSINGAGIDLAPLYRLLDAMVAQARRYTDKIILIGQMLGYVDLPTSLTGEGGVRATHELSYAIINNCVQINAYQRRTYAGWFFDAHQYHLDNNGGQARTIAPNGVNKTYNILTIGAVSPKLSDGLHENTAVGQPETAAGVKAMIEARRL